MIVGRDAPARTPPRVRGRYCAGSLLRIQQSTTCALYSHSTRSPWTLLAGMGHAATADAHCGTTTVAATTTGAAGSATWN